ncbi:unnamed protein product [Amoebophrya sp. A25]|nr:unnamed protein product [Amoebophrya sp. A25]|eukprot:GSA25T00024199001.1
MTTSSAARSAPPSSREEASQLSSRDHPPSWVLSDNRLGAATVFDADDDQEDSIFDDDDDAHEIDDHVEGVEVVRGGPNNGGGSSGTGAIGLGPARGQYHLPASSAADFAYSNDLNAHASGSLGYLTYESQGLAQEDDEFFPEATRGTEAVLEQPGEPDPTISTSKQTTTSAYTSPVESTVSHGRVGLRSTVIHAATLQTRGASRSMPSSMRSSTRRGRTASRSASIEREIANFNINMAMKRRYQKESPSARMRQNMKDKEEFCHEKRPLDHTRTLAKRFSTATHGGAGGADPLRNKLSVTKSRRESLLNTSAEATRSAMQASMKDKRSLLIGGSAAEGEGGGQAKPRFPDPDFSISLALRPKSSYAVRTLPTEGFPATPSSNVRKGESFMRSESGPLRVCVVPDKETLHSLLRAPKQEIILPERSRRIRSCGNDDDIQKQLKGPQWNDYGDRIVQSRWLPSKLPVILLTDSLISDTVDDERGAGRSSCGIMEDPMGTGVYSTSNMASQLYTLQGGGGGGGGFQGMNKGAGGGIVKSSGQLESGETNKLQGRNLFQQESVAGASNNATTRSSAAQNKYRVHQDNSATFAEPLGLGGGAAGEQVSPSVKKRPFLRGPQDMFFKSSFPSLMKGATSGSAGGGSSDAGSPSKRVRGASPSTETQSASSSVWKTLVYGPLAMLGFGGGSSSSSSSTNFGPRRGGSSSEGAGNVVDKDSNTAKTKGTIKAGGQQQHQQNEELRVKPLLAGVSEDEVQELYRCTNDHGASIFKDLDATSSATQSDSASRGPVLFRSGGTSSSRPRRANNMQSSTSSERTNNDRQDQNDETGGFISGSPGSLVVDRASSNSLVVVQENDAGGACQRAGDLNILPSNDAGGACQRAGGLNILPSNDAGGACQQAGGLNVLPSPDKPPGSSSGGLTLPLGGQGGRSNQHAVDNNVVDLDISGISPTSRGSPLAAAASSKNPRNNPPTPNRRNTTKKSKKSRPNTTACGMCYSNPENPDLLVFVGCKLCLCGFDGWLCPLPCANVAHQPWGPALCCFFTLCAPFSVPFAAPVAEWWTKSSKAENREDGQTQDQKGSGLIDTVTPLQTK